MENKLPFYDILKDEKWQFRKNIPGIYDHTFGAEITNVYRLTETEKLYQIQLIDPKERSRFTFRPGQFVMLSPGALGAATRSDPLLPRPMAVYRSHAARGTSPGTTEEARAR